MINLWWFVTKKILKKGKPLVISFCLEETTRQRFLDNYGLVSVEDCHLDPPNHTYCTWQFIPQEQKLRQKQLEIPLTSLVALYTSSVLFIDLSSNKWKFFICCSTDRWIIWRKYMNLKFKTRCTSVIVHD